MASARRRVETRQRGRELLADPLLNQGTAFTHEERRAFEIEGLLPHVVSPLELQARRVYENICRKTDPLERYIGLAALQDRNEHLYYRVLLDHLEELLPIVYTPTVGQASKRYSHIFRRGRGVWITPEHRGRIAEVLRAARPSGVRLIVVTDNQAILGIGDQGAGGMVIPIGKLAIYSAAAGIHPAETLPVSLDVGTDNQELLDDEFYMGWPERRLRGEPYCELVEEFAVAASELWPGVLIQWEDFQKSNAFEVLERYRERVLSFNDDIQGTGATALAGLIAACRISGTTLSEQRVVIVGGGAAGKGIARQVRSALVEAGVTGVALETAVAVLDSGGLIAADRDRLDDYKRDLAWSGAALERVGLGEQRGLAEVVRALRPTALIGTSGQAGLFSQEIVRAMAANVERPIVFPFSNPTDHAEAKPADLLEWTEGRALVATGSPFDPVELGRRAVHFGQGNNALIFPGVGLGSLASGATEVTDSMFFAAARALADSILAEELDHEQVYPSVGRLREVTLAVAAAVFAAARDAGVGQDLSDEEIPRVLDQRVWEPVYPELVPV